MPFYFRKSVSAGPFRFNFSKSGVGVSVGVRGLRIGTGPRGHYIHAGSNGFYYRASLGRTSVPPRSRPAPPNLPPPPAQAPAGVNMVEIDSANVLALQDETFGDLLKELNEKASQARLSVIVPTLLGIVGFGAAYIIGSQVIWLVILALPGWLLGRWLDSYKRTSVLFYDLEGEQQGRYSKLTDAFDNLMSCAGKWHVEAQGRIYDLMTRKRSALATNLVRKKNTKVTYELPAVIKSNITPPLIQAGRQTLYFLPDVVLIAEGNRFGAVSYSDLRIDTQPSRFIEDGRVPSDAQVVDYTWQYANKNGGPDRRFNNNRQIPICLYDSLQLSSPSGLNELFEFSRTGVADGLAAAAEEMHTGASSSISSPATAASGSPWESDGNTPADSPPAQKRRYAGKVVIGLILMGVAYALIASPQPDKEAAPARPATAASTPAQAPRPAAAKADDKQIASTPIPSPAKPEPPAAPPKDDRPLLPAEVRELQERLKALGFDPGFIDGIPGPQTAAAIKRFEASASLPQQGNVDRVTLQRLRDAKPTR